MYHKNLNYFKIIDNRICIDITDNSYFFEFVNDERDLFHFNLGYDLEYFTCIQTEVFN